MSRHTATLPTALAARGAERVERWVIERLVAGGEGLARLPDGRVGFAARVACGDEIEPLEIEHRKSYCRARRWRLLAAGPGRVEPSCPVVGHCGGCDWMHLGREAQLAAKHAIVVEALGRMGGVDVPFVVPPVRTAGEPWRYRSRLRLHVDARGRLGLFGRASRELCEIDDCLVCAPPIRAAIARLRDLLRRHTRSALDPFDVEIRVAPAGSGTTLLLFEPRRGALPRGLVEALRAAFPMQLASERASTGAEQRFPLLGSTELVVPPSAFTQVNWAVNQELVRAVVAGATAGSMGSFVDLFCGAGNFSLPLLAAGLGGIGIERSVDAVQAAARAAREQGLTRGTFYGGDVLDRLRWLCERGGRFGLVVLDPPRAGARGLAPLVAALDPALIALCACDPVTAARDVALLGQAGYRLTSVEIFDMFPQTHHAELLGWLERDSRHPFDRRSVSKGSAARRRGPNASSASSRQSTRRKSSTAR